MYGLKVKVQYRPRYVQLYIHIYVYKYTYIRIFNWSIFDWIPTQNRANMVHSIIGWYTNKGHVNLLWKPYQTNYLMQSSHEVPQINNKWQKNDIGFAVHGIWR